MEEGKDDGRQGSSITRKANSDTGPSRPEEKDEAQGIFAEEDVDEENDEDEEDDEDCFFESLDRVPSGISVDFDIASSGSDSEDDVRVSFASAIGPPSDFRRVAAPDDEYDDDDVEGRREEDYDYGIWMAEPISIKERRRLLLRGMGLASSKDLSASRGRGSGPLCLAHALSRRLSRKPTVKDPAASFAAGETPALESSPSAMSRSRSDPQILLAAAGSSSPSSSPHPALRRAYSAPSSSCGRPSVGRRGVGLSSERGDQEGASSSSTPGDALAAEAAGMFRIKNLDTGKEFVVSEFGKDGTWGRLNDLQTGLQLSLEEFERCLGFSPIVKELMRRVNLGGGGDRKGRGGKTNAGSAKDSKSGSSSSSRKKGGGWLKNIKFVASSVTGLISEKDRDISSSGRLGGANSSGSEWLKVRQHGKSHKELTGLYMCQEIHAHQGAIWSIKFSSDARYLASAGEDRVVHVWQALESGTSSLPLQWQDPRSAPQQPTSEGSAEQAALLLGSQPSKRTRKGKVSSANNKKSIPEHIVMPETVFCISDKPVCSFRGHLDDVLDLSWSKSQFLLSSSMDKTVRLWDMETKACLQLFAHNDYVTCIQFNPIDEKYFISGSLDAKVRIWSIPDHQVVDWTDLHEMVTAACFTPNGQGALVGSHKGSCRFYNTSDCKLYQEGQVEIRNKKRKSHAKKITGFQFAPGNPSEVLITSADSQIRVFDGVAMIHKFRGFRNTSSQISASFTSGGKYVVCASEDSQVYVWKRDVGRNSGVAGRSKGWVTTRSHEHFHCKDVSVAIPWPGSGCNNKPAASLQSLPWGQDNNHQQSLVSSDSLRSSSTLGEIFSSGRSHCPPPVPKKSFSPEDSRCPSRSESGIDSLSFASAAASPSLRPAAVATGASSSISASSSSLSSSGWYGGVSNRATSTVEEAGAWGLVVVTAGLGGDIRIYQNFGLPLRLSRQNNLF